KSLNELFTRYDVLRTAFIHEGFDRPVQLVLKDRRVDFYYRDIREMAGESREAFIKEFKEKDRQRSFDPAEDVLMRVAILQTAAGEYEFTWSHHHILMDGWCIGILISEFFEIYNSYLENRDYRLPPAQPYREYIEWLEKRDKEESKQYWTEYLEGYTRPAGFSKTTAPAAQGLKRRKKTEFSLDTPQTHRLKTSAANNHVTLYSVVQAAWGVLLGKYTGRPDVVFVGVVSGRPSGIEGVETMVGLFINTIPVRFRYRENNTLLQLVKTVHQQSIDSEPHHYYPLADIQAAAPLKQKLFDHILVFLNYPIDQQIGETAALTISGIESFEQSNFDLEVAILSTYRFTVSLDYNANVYDGALMERVADNLKQLLSRFSENEETAVSELS
ncbi:MAG: non-ribosomal peptide synthetase, partial [bacterium]|nr:non-ribosomal peptide synthetase [bacterium]